MLCIDLYTQHDRRADQQLKSEAGLLVGGGSISAGKLIGIVELVTILQ